MADQAVAAAGATITAAMADKQRISRTRVTRRSMLSAIAALGGTAAFFRTPGLFAEAVQDSVVLTPRQTAGPFYPDELPLDTDNDLLIINDSVTPAGLGGRQTRDDL